MLEETIFADCKSGERGLTRGRAVQLNKSKVGQEGLSFRRDHGPP